MVGGGPIGLELGQAFARLGSKVTVFEADRCLAKQDPDLAAVVLDQLRADGLDIREGAKVEGFEAGATVLVATGRAPNVEGLNLEAAGVAYDTHGIHTDRSLRTTNRRVFAVGDITGRPAFTHLAGAHAALFVRRALFASPVNAFHENDRAQTEADTRGFGKVITGRKGAILGAAIVGRNAGDLIAPFTLAMSAGVKLSAIAGMIAPYPTRGEIVKRLAGQWYSPILFAPRTRALVSLLKRLA